MTKHSNAPVADVGEKIETLTIVSRGVMVAGAPRDLMTKVLRTASMFTWLPVIGSPVNQKANASVWVMTHCPAPKPQPTPLPPAAAGLPMLAAIIVAPVIKLTAVITPALNAVSASLRVRDMAISSRFQTTCMDTDSTLDPALSSVKQRLYGPAMRPESKWVGRRPYRIKPL